MRSCLSDGLLGRGQIRDVTAYQFEFRSCYSAFDRSQRSVEVVVWSWVMGRDGGAVGTDLSGGRRLRFCVSVTEMVFTLICGASAVLILEALR